MKSDLVPSLIVIVTASVLFAPSAHALQPDQIALIVNKNVPEGLELARFYAQSRGIPDGRIIELDLPVGDQMPFDRYEPDVQLPTRQLLQARALDQRVTCLVTFYGVPLRIAVRAVTPEETAEIAGIREETKRVQRVINPSIERLEALAARFDPAFRLPVPATETIARRAEVAARVVNAAAQRTPAGEPRQGMLRELARISALLNAPVGDPPTTGPTSQHAQPATQPLDPAQLAPLLSHQGDPAARQRLRELARRSGHPFAYEKLLQEQALLLNPEHTDSALDSELALLWLDGYSRAGWQPNPLGYPFIGNPSGPNVLMVMRLDAPSVQIVRNLIADSITIEREGLKGRFVIDSRGIPAKKPNAPDDAFGVFDQRLRELATLVKTRTRMELILDDAPDVLPANSVTDVALYCGWYSVAKYVQAMKFSRGAVAFHVASYELTSLRDPANPGWCRALLNDGVTATLGAVAEPILHAFPVPDDFFPLLLTGRLTLAEVYWRSCPMTSWKLSMIGDPLYTPFRGNPALSIHELPPRLRAAFSDPTTKP